MAEGSSSAQAKARAVHVEDWEQAYEEKKGTIISSAEWEDHKEIFEELYQNEETLNDVRKKLAQDHDFYTTTAQCKKMIKKWNLSKNLKEEQWDMIIGARKKREDRDNKKTIFLVRGKPVDEKRVKRAETRYKNKSRPAREQHSIMHNDPLLHLITYRTPGSNAASPRNISELLSPLRPDEDTSMSDGEGLHINEDVDYQVNDNSDISMLDSENIDDQVHCLVCNGTENRILEDDFSKLPNGKFIQCVSCQETFRLRNIHDDSSNLEIKRVIIISGEISRDKEEISEKLVVHQNDPDSVVVRWVCPVCPVCERVHGSGTSLLSAASACNLKEIVKSLLDSQVEIDSKDLDGRTALHWAVEYEHVEIIEMLSNSGSDLRALDADGLSPLGTAVMLSSINSVRALLQLRPQLLHTPNPNEVHPLLIALRYSTPNTARLILRATPSIDKIYGKNKSTPLLEAVFNARAAVQMCMIIIPRIWKQDLAIEQTNEQGETAVFLAAKIGRIDILELLTRNKASVETANLQGKTPLMCAAETGDDYLAARLLKLGASPDTVDEYGATALIVAARNGSLGVATWLLDYNATIEAEIQGKTALFYAAENRDEDFVELLIDRKANVENCLHIAYNRENQEVADFVLKIAIRKEPWKYSE